MTTTNHDDLTITTTTMVIEGKVLAAAEATIEMISQADTPEAKSLYLSYRAAEAVLARTQPWLDERVRRVLAIRQAMKEDGCEASFLD